MVSAAEASSYDPVAYAAQLERVQQVVAERAAGLAELPVASTKEAIERCLQELPDELPKDGLGLEATTSQLLDTIAPSLMPGQAGPRCFGLVLGGVSPAALLADLLVTSFDPCVQVHWPEKTSAVALEQLALSYLLSLLELPPTIFTQNTFTTGATASNILGVACGREWTVSRIKRSQGFEGWSVAEDGFGGVDVDIFVADSHASMRKAASLAGVGRRNVVDLCESQLEKEGHLVCFNLAKLEERLKENLANGRASIVATSFGEVNTGAINSDTPALRSLCNRYHAWLHIDAAFGAFAILHPDFEPYKPHLALADSISSDAHKWLQVPYDCGLFFSRPRSFPYSTSDSTAPASLFSVTGPGGSVPAYLASASSVSQEEEALYPRIAASKAIPSPLFMNIENSRRFRALPVLASLLSLGREGYASLIQRNIAFARQIESFLRSHPSYDVLTPATSTASVAEDPFAFRLLNIVLFAPSSAAPSRYREASQSDPDPAGTFLDALNSSKDVFLTPTTWRGRKAVRLAVSNWGTELEEGKEWNVVREVLERVMEK